MKGIILSLILLGNVICPICDQYLDHVDNQHIDEGYVIEDHQEDIDLNNIKWPTD